MVLAQNWGRSSITDSEVAESAFLRVLETVRPYTRYRRYSSSHTDCSYGGYGSTSLAYILAWLHTISVICQVGSTCMKVHRLLIRIMEPHPNRLPISTMEPAGKSAGSATTGLKLAVVFRATTHARNAATRQLDAFRHHIIGTSAHSEMLSGVQYFRSSTLKTDW